MKSQLFNEMVLVVIPDDAHVQLEDIDTGMTLTMRLMRHQDVLNGWYDRPGDRDMRYRHLTEADLPTLTQSGLIKGFTPTGRTAKVVISA